MQVLYRLLPPTIHPMVVHFTISVIYLAALAGLAGLLFRTQRAFFSLAFLWLLLLSILATLAAGVAGVVSESYVHVSGVVGPMLHNHKEYGELTGVLVVISFILQWLRQRKSAQVSWLAFIVCLIAVVTVSLAGYLGGSMVYDHGLGVH